VNTAETNIQTLQQAMTDSVKLVKLHVDLIREEAKSMGNLASMTVTFWLLVNVVAVPAFLLLLLGLNHFLQDVTKLATWQSELIVAAVFLGLCAGAVLYARTQFLKLKEGLV
jgi:hypothetical protein